MVKKKNTILFALLFYFVFTNAFSQIDPLTNSFSSADNSAETVPVQQEMLNHVSQLPGINCTPNTFWANHSLSGIDEFTLNAGVINFTSTIVNSTYYANLAYCNNLDNGAFSPTFYDSQISTVAFYDGNSWITSSQFPSNSLYNCGGNGNFLFYVSVIQGPPGTITRYNNGAFTTIFTLQDTTRFFTVADLAVDDSGNVWFFTGPVNPGTIVTDTLNVISPSGQMLKQFPFSYDTGNAYGSFLLNGVLYIGLGPANTIHPNTLVPITISANTAIAGAPLSMPGLISYGDLASCNTGTPLSVNENAGTMDFRIFPNPANNELYLHTGSMANEKKLSFTLYDLQGRAVLQKMSFDASKPINVSAEPEGLYVAVLKGIKKEERKKVVIQR